MTAFAEWLNSFFSGMDAPLLGLYHELALHGGEIWTPLCRAVTFLGEKGLWMFAAAVILFFFPRTRKMAVCLFGAVCCGALITNVLLKDTVCRLRPFLADPGFTAFWNYIGAPPEDGFSFPSGHATAAAAGMTALLLTGKKKSLWLGLGIPYVALMCASRNYLMAHYPSDVLIGAVIGVLSAFAAWAITRAIFSFLEAHRDAPFCRFVLTFSLRKKKKA